MKIANVADQFRPLLEPQEYQVMRRTIAAREPGSRDLGDDAETALAGILGALAGHAVHGLLPGDTDHRYSWVHTDLRELTKGSITERLQRRGELIELATAVLLEELGSPEVRRRVIAGGLKAGVPHAEAPQPELRVINGAGRSEPVTTAAPVGPPLTLADRPEMKALLRQRHILKRTLPIVGIALPQVTINLLGWWSGSPGLGVALSILLSATLAVSGYTIGSTFRLGRERELRDRVYPTTDWHKQRKA